MVSAYFLFLPDSVLVGCVSRNLSVSSSLFNCSHLIVRLYDSLYSGVSVVMFPLSFYLFDFSLIFLVCQFCSPFQKTILSFVVFFNVFLLSVPFISALIC